MESAIAVVVAPVMTVGLAVVLGYLIEKWLGVTILGLLALFASIFCLVGLGLGYSLAGTTGAWTGLLVSVVLVGVIAANIFSKITSSPRSSRFVLGAWFSYSALCIFGYLAGGWVGLLTITLVAVTLFWVEFYRISSDLLPLRNKQDKVERAKAFRSLVTFSMGTNYPYYFVDEESQPVKRVDGNSFYKFFAGPGFVITTSDHAAYVTDGIFVKGVFEPGLTFTGKYDMEPRIIDLRSQLRAFPVDALTKDGIPIKVVTFIPYRIDSGNQAVELGRAFPFRQAAVYQALANEMVERKPDKTDRESGKKYKWDGGPGDGLVPLLATPVVQDVISRYNVDELCAPFSDKDPRVEIAAEIKDKVKEILRERGLEMIGGGISNLVPLDENIIRQRVDNWRTKWIGRILTQMSQSQAYRMNQLELARAKSEIEVVKRFGQIARSSVQSDLNRTLILGLIDSIRNVVGDKEGQWPLPNKELEETLKRLRGEIKGDSHLKDG